MTPRRSFAIRSSCVCLAASLLVGTAAATATAPAPVANSTLPAAKAPKTGHTPPPTNVRSIEGVSEYRLANGLQILLFPDASSSTVTVNLTYRVGSRHESYGETGMAHLLEHLMFKGTPTHTNIPNELTSHGAQANATTAEDRTNYFETLPATDANLDWALELEADRMLHSYIAQKDLDSEMTVVRNEFERGENSPASILRERVLATAYLWHNYGHPTIGARADIEHVPIKRLQTFYHTYYQPDNATLIVTGKFDAAKTLALVHQVYGPIAKPTRTLPELYTEEPTQDGEREVTLRRTGGEKILMESFHIPADAQGDSAAIGLLAGMLSERPAGRLHKALVETKIATQASASPTSAHDPGYLMFTVMLAKDGDLGAARKALDAVIASLATAPFSEEDFARARTQQLNDYERLMSSAPDLASALSENVAVGDWRLLFWDRDQMKKVTIADVTRVSATYLVSSNLTVGTFVPEEKAARAAIPQAQPLEAMLKNYTGDIAVEAGEFFDPTPANIDARTQRSTVGSLKAAFLEKKTRGGRVNAVLNLRFGTAPSLERQAEVGRFTAGLLMRGTQKHTRQQIQDELTRLHATMNVQGAASGVSVALETTRENLQQVLRLAAEVLREPAFPADQIDESKRQYLAQIDSQRTEPEPLAFKVGQRYLSPYGVDDFRYVPTFDEQAKAVGAITAESLRQFHQHFYGASNGEIAIVGSFDEAAATKTLDELFGNWKSPSPYERAPGVYVAKLAKSETIKTPDKANAVFFSAANLNLSDNDESYPSLEVGNAILGGGFLNSRLATRIRQKDGVSYSVGSQIQVDSQDPVGAFYVFAICAPQNIGKVNTDAKEEIAHALQSGFTTDEITAAKTGLLQSRLVGRSSDNELAGDLANHVYLGRTYAWDTKYEQAISAATSDSIQKAMQRHVDPAKLLVIEAGDFK